MQNLSWTPSPEVVEQARVTAFMREQGIDEWRQLHARAQDDIGWFWDAVVKHLGIEFFTPYEQVFDDSRRADVDALVRRRHDQPDPQLRRSSRARHAAAHRPDL